MEKSIITAKVETPSGLKVEVSGTKEEVKQLLESLSPARPSAADRSASHRRPSPTGKWGPAVNELIADNFFASERTIADTVIRLNEKGYSVRGRAIGALAKTLSVACRDPKTGLQRRQLSGAERKGNEQWAFLQRK